MNQKKFGEGCMNYEVSDPIRNLVLAWKHVAPSLAQGWHTASISFELNDQGEMVKVDEMKVYICESKLIRNENWIRVGGKYRHVEVLPATSKSDGGLYIDGVKVDVDVLVTPN